MHFEGFACDPLDTVQPLLKDVVRARLEIVLFPAAKPVGGIAVGIAIIAAEGLDRRAIGLAVKLVDSA